MTFSSMEYFVTLARERSFTKAAEQLHITQQSLSSHIAGMEKELGCKLLVRHIPLELTYAGSVLLEYAQNFQKDYTAMQQEFCDITRNQKGELRVGIALTRGRALMPDILPRFHEQYPRIRVDLTEASNAQLLELLQARDIDLAIAGFPASLPGVILEDFCREEAVMFISTRLYAQLHTQEPPSIETGSGKSDRIFSSIPDSVKDWPFVLGDENDIAGRIGQEFFRAHEITRPLVLATSQNMMTLLALCVRGIGACFCPLQMARAVLSPDEFESLRCFRLGKEAEIPIRFGYLKQSYQWSVISAFMECARDAVSIDAAPVSQT